MHKETMKQVLFLAFFVAALVLVLGFWVVTTAKAASPAPASDFRYLLTAAADSDDEWEDDFDRPRRGRKRDRSEAEVRYNRVEGLYLGMKLNPPGGATRRMPRTGLFGFWGYAFAAKEFQYQIGLEKGFFDDFRFSVGGEYHHRIATPDLWIMPEDENSAAAFLLKEDFHDYYLTEGASAWVSQNAGRALKFTAGWQSGDDEAVRRHARWSLFGGKKRFRGNPAMDEGRTTSLSASVVLDTRNSAKRTTRGWYVQIEGEHAGDDLGGDFTYDRFVADLRRYQPLGYGEGVDIRLRAGTSYGTLPWQKSFHLGGPSTLRGYAYKAFPAGWGLPGGNRMVLAQLEYRLGEEDLPDPVDFGLLEQFNLIAFTDAGWVGDAGPEADMIEGFDGLTFRRLKHDVGLALANRSGNVRLEVARRTDTGHKPYSVWFRINRPF